MRLQSLSVLSIALCACGETTSSSVDATEAQGSDASGNDAGGNDASGTDVRADDANAGETMIIGDANAGETIADVTAGPQEITATTYREGRQAAATWVAFQDGESAWEEITGNDGVYRFTITSGRYGIAAVCTDETPKRVRLNIVHATTGELPFLPISCKDTGSGETTEVSGSVSGIDEAGAAVFAGLSFADVDVNGKYHINLHDRPYDLVATRLVDFGFCSDCELDRLLSVPGFAAGPGATTLDFDLEANGVVLETHRLQAIGNALATPYVSYFTANGTMVLLNRNASTPFVPLDGMQPGDTHIARG